jgi:hypothetical protein
MSTQFIPQIYSDRKYFYKTNRWQNSFQNFVRFPGGSSKKTYPTVFYYIGFYYIGTDISYLYRLVIPINSCLCVQFSIDISVLSLLVRIHLNQNTGTSIVKKVCLIINGYIGFVYIGTSISI